MQKPLLSIFICLVLTASLQALAQSQKSELKYTVPVGWIEETRSSSMRVAQYKLPKAPADAEDASLVLYYFGQGQGGSTTANVERWLGQVKQADGGAAKDAKEDHFETNGLKVTTVDVSGTYVAETAPGSGTFHNSAGYRLRAAVVETPNGSYYVKFVGPEKTVARWNDSFQSYLKSFELK